MYSKLSQFVALVAAGAVSVHCQCTEPQTIGDNSAGVPKEVLADMAANAESVSGPWPVVGYDTSKRFPLWAAGAGMDGWTVSLSVTSEYYWNDTNPTTATIVSYSPPSSNSTVDPTWGTHTLLYHMDVDVPEDTVNDQSCQSILSPGCLDTVSESLERGMAIDFRENPACQADFQNVVPVSIEDSLREMTNYPLDLVTHEPENFDAYNASIMKVVVVMIAFSEREPTMGQNLQTFGQKLPGVLACLRIVNVHEGKAIQCSSFPNEHGINTICE